MDYLRIYHPRPAAELRLVCLPHAGGTATAYRGWGSALPPWIELVSIQYPGRQDRLADPFVADLTTLITEVIAALPRDRPMAVFGHSMGATVGYELARRLPPVHLFLSAPASAVGRRLDTSDDDRLVADVQRLGGSGVALLDHPEIRRLALPAIRHDACMLAAHEIADGPPPDCPVTVLAGDADVACSPDAARRWARRTTAGFDLRVFPGGHHYLEDAGDQVVRLLAEKLEASRTGAR
ncbi:thioesterase II family protein [Actinoplanes utahensis]|uniref:Thioesterase domain-containing protein n=1 Tax=Actinoplanes utahensis TaxID=1869 RepID=A0A0A6UP54_ACTUT|nr:alpha/beta fold hydrolase [Actinoplanes utahensis]KHD76823.1 hypothetical protein MB27_14875 [Actinoplanes utahensis]GIF33401.1 thioesterase [Actinoplanes utahensis]